MKNILFAIILALLVITSIMSGCQKPTIPGPDVSYPQLSRFSSDEELLDALKDAQERGRGWFGGVTLMKLGGVQEAATASFDSAAPGTGAGREYSETNVQVEGVDEADIVKTDGEYIYALANNNLIIAKAYPAEEAEVESILTLPNFYTRELFVHGDRLLVFGLSNYNLQLPSGQGEEAGSRKKFAYSRHLGGFTTTKLYDISNRKDPKLIKTVDIEGNYLTSRKIGSDVYFVINSYPRYWEEKLCSEILPLYRETASANEPTKDDMKPIAGCTDIGYVPPMQANNFITIAAMSMSDESKDVKKETIVGSGQNVYASLENLYIAQTSWPVYTEILGELAEEQNEKTVITKFKLENGEIKFTGTGEVKGYILNQFSMDEYDGHFRIATTKGQVWNEEKKSANNVYVLDESLNVVGRLEDLAPGEKIYSVRFMGKKGYMVTFKKVDPLFVIDLSDHTNPNVLGKLKIPGYSDYLHPYDENHIIGIGKEAVEAENEVTGQQLDFAWYQGMKMAIFDVTDVNNPVEMHKVIIGDRGTDSDALRDHKAFLFDRERNLLVIPITLAEIKGEKTMAHQYGEFTFQGAYVYDLTLENGFQLKGRVTHYDDNEEFIKSGYYFSGTASIMRSLYIEDVLYTLSNTRLQMNSLDNLEKIKALSLGEIAESPYVDGGVETIPSVVIA